MIPAKKLRNRPSKTYPSYAKWFQNTFFNFEFYLYFTKKQRIVKIGEFEKHVLILSFLLARIVPKNKDKVL